MTKIAVFDLDDTLYRSSEFHVLFEKAIYSSISTANHLSIEHAKELFNKKRSEIKNQTGGAPGTTQTLYSYFEVSINDFEKHKLNQIELMGMPELNTKEINNNLKQAIVTLSKYYVPVLFTNNHLSLTNLILKKINLENVFDSVYTLNDMPDSLAQKIKKKDMPFDETDNKILSYIKPSKDRILNILSKYNADPLQSVSIGDRYSIDHIYSEELGMTIVIVEKVEDVINACCNLCK